MKRSWLVWIGFSLCVAATAAAMTWMTCAVVRLDRAEAEARRQAALEENVRLALWRADATLAPLVTQESLAPWFAYRPVLPNRQPSPFLAAATPHVLVHFQFEPDGRISSPEVPPEPASSRPPGRFPPSGFSAAQEQLARLATADDSRATGGTSPSASGRSGAGAVATVVPQTNCPSSTLNDSSAVSAPAAEPVFPARAIVAVEAKCVRTPRSRPKPSSTPATTTRTSTTAPATATAHFNNDIPVSWQRQPALDGQRPRRADDSALGRRQPGLGPARLGRRTRVCPGLSLGLAGHSRVARRCGRRSPAGGHVRAGADGAAVDPSRMLAALPLRIVPGEFPGEAAAGLSPMLLSLVVAWGLHGGDGRDGRLSSGGHPPPEQSPRVVRHRRDARAADAADHVPDVRRNAGRRHGAATRSNRGTTSRPCRPRPPG